MSEGRKVVPLQEGKKRLEKKRYAALVLHAYDDLQHQEKRAQQEQRAAVERKARNEL